MQTPLIVNPFRPGHPVPPGVFAGRAKELTQILRSFLQTEKGMPQNILITGERGIGKTSVSTFAKALAQKKILWMDSSPKEPFMVADTIVQKGTAGPVIVRDILREIIFSLKLSGRTEFWLNSFIDKFKEIKIAGTGFTLSDNKPTTAEQIYNEARESIRQTISQFEKIYGTDKLPTICLIIDEVDQISDFDGFASFWKTLQETLASDGFLNFMLILVGMPSIYENLTSDHPSLLRSFTPIVLDKMEQKEVVEIIDNCLQEGEPVRGMTEDAIEKITLYSDRFPHLIQELGYSAFEVCEKNLIDASDVEKGIVGTKDYPGSIQRLGNLFFNQKYDEVKKSENYKEILHILAIAAGKTNNWVTRQDILAKFSKKKTSLDSFLQELIKKEILIRNKDQNGQYRLYSSMFRTYIETLLPKS